MKINLLIDNPGDFRSGYLNIDPQAPECDQQGRIRGDVFNLDSLVDDAEASEIVAHDLLDLLPGEAVDTVLDNWLKKLARGGTLAVSTVDYREVARAIIAGSLSPEDINELLHGKQEKPWQFRRCSLTLALLAEVLHNKGYQILTQRVQNYRAVVVCRRS